MNSRQSLSTATPSRGWMQRKRPRWTSAHSRCAHDEAIDEQLPIRVLLAEDDPDMRHLIAGRLKSDGCDVKEICEGTELISILCRMMLEDPEISPVDVIVSDVMMPGVSGLDALRALRRIDSMTPVVLITAFGSPELHSEAEALGAVVLDKPFDLGELLGLVRRSWTTLASDQAADSR